MKRQKTGTSLRALNEYRQESLMIPIDLKGKVALVAGVGDVVVPPRTYRRDMASSDTPACRYSSV